MHGTEVYNYRRIRWLCTKSHELHAAWNRDGSEPEPCWMKNGLLKTASLLRIFRSRISGRNLRNRTRGGSNNDLQICDTRIGYQRNPDALRLKRVVMEEICVEKNKQRSSRFDERYLDIGQSPEMPEWNEQWLQQRSRHWRNGASRTECKIENGGTEATQVDCSPDSRTGGQIPNCGV